MPPPLL